jgi:hypothetical protein
LYHTISIKRNIKIVVQVWPLNSGYVTCSLCPLNEAPSECFQQGRTVCRGPNISLNLFRHSCFYTLHLRTLWWWVSRNQFLGMFLPCGVTDRYQSFRGNCCLYIHYGRMNAAGSSKMLVPIYSTTWHHISNHNLIVSSIQIRWRWWSVRGSKDCHTITVKPFSINHSLTHAFYLHSRLFQLNIIKYSKLWLLLRIWNA